MPSVAGHAQAYAQGRHPVAQTVLFARILEAVWGAPSHFAMRGISVLGTHRGERFWLAKQQRGRLKMGPLESIGKLFLIAMPFKR